MKTSTPFGKKLFAEEQPFRKSWVWTLVAIASIIPIIIVVVVMMADHNTKPQEMAIAFSVVLVSNAIPLWLLYLLRLDTIVTDEAVFYRWWPIFKKYHVIRWSAIKDAYVKKYPYLNTGYHKRKGFGKVNVVKGDKGVQLELQNGQQIYLGTQRLPAFEHALNTIIPEKPVSV